MKRFFKVIFHIVGLSCMTVATFWLTSAFIIIIVYGGWLGIEPNMHIAVMETALFLYASGYAVYCFIKTMRRFRETP